MPPIEKPSTSILFKPSARLKATALAPICSNVVGTSPELLETPALLNKITSRSRAKPSHRRVPVVHGARVVLVEDDRHSADLAESAIGEANPLTLYTLFRPRLVGLNHFAPSF